MEMTKYFHSTDEARKAQLKLISETFTSQVEWENNLSSKLSGL
jgi:hypothetical protein